MKGERQLLRIGEHLVGSACQRLPRKIRDDCYREWTAELPAILHDPQVRFASHRAVRMLSYAADTIRGTALTPGGPRRQTAPPARIVVVGIIVGLAGVVDGIWNAVQAPGDSVSYAQMAWYVLLVAWYISQYRLTARITTLIGISAGLAGVVYASLSVARAPGDWASYVMAAGLLVLVVGWLIGRRVRTRRACCKEPLAS